MVRAFEAGWGGVVWKTVGEDPHVVNVYGPRYAALLGPDRRVIGFNNIELISDRPLRTNLEEIKRVKRDWPDRAMIVSIMVPVAEESWKRILPMVEDTGCDGIELNFGCPHGMSERGMGSAVGQVPEYIEAVARWCKMYTRLPVIVKLTPNITDVRFPARAARRGGADAVSLINTINSIMGVDLDTMTMLPSTGGLGSHGGYCGTAVKPIALNMVAEIARDPANGALADLRHRRHRHLARRRRIHCAGLRHGAGVHRGDGVWLQDCRRPVRRLVELHGSAGLCIDRRHGRQGAADGIRLALPGPEPGRQGGHQPGMCIQCGRCHVVCEDTSHQAISATKDGKRHFEIKEDACVGCNLCVSICPVRTASRCARCNRARSISVPASR